MSIEAMKQALEALELVLETDTKPKHEISKSITSLRQAIEQAEKQEPVAWINWCAATGKRSVSFECESELASQPLYAGITQNTQDHYSKFHSWFDSELHRKKYTQDHPAYLAAQEAWNAANDAAQYRINRLNAEIEACKVRFKIAEDALAKLNGPEQKPVAWMFEGIKFDGSKHGPHLVWKPEYMDAMSADMGAVAIPLYTTPPHRKPLTDEEIAKIASTPCAVVGSYVHTFARAIEAAHGIKE